MIQSNNSTEMCLACTTFEKVEDLEGYTLPNGDEVPVCKECLKLEDETLFKKLEANYKEDI